MGSIPQFISGFCVENQSVIDKTSLEYFYGVYSYPLGILSGETILFIDLPCSALIQNSSLGKGIMTLLER